MNDVKLKYPLVRLNADGVCVILSDDTMDGFTARWKDVEDLTIDDCFVGLGDDGPEYLARCISGLRALADRLESQLKEEDTIDVP